MIGDDPLAAWRANPFFILEVSTEASRTEVERAGQKLLGLLALGSASAARYETPLGPASRDADSVRQATEHELKEQTWLRKTDDFKEGVKATAERRLPNFLGR